jgi:hypothetical protein
VKGRATLKHAFLASLIFGAFAGSALAAPIAPGDTAATTVFGNTPVYQIFGHAGNPGGDYSGPVNDAVLYQFAAGASNVFTFAASGLTSCCSNTPDTPPDGAFASTSIVGANGLSNVAGNTRLPLLGVFTTDTDPFGSAAPAGLSWDAKVRRRFRRFCSRSLISAMAGRATRIRWEARCSSPRRRARRGFTSGSRTPWASTARPVSTRTISQLCRDGEPCGGSRAAGLRDDDPRARALRHRRAAQARTRRRAHGVGNFMNRSATLAAALLFGLLATPAQAGLVHSYSFASGTAQDFTGSANGMLNGGATISAGFLHLDGTGFVSFGSSFLVPSGTDFSVALNARMTGSVAGQYAEIISQGFSGAPGFYIGYDPSHNIRLGDTWLSTGLAFPSDGRLHDYLLSSSTSATSFYIDGNLALQRSGRLPIPTSGTATLLGKQFAPFAEFFIGDLG